MTPRFPWQRVSKSKPCPICDRADWCLISADGNAAICPRVESAKQVGEAGWLHRLHVNNQFRFGPRVRSIPLKSDGSFHHFEEIDAEYRKAVDTATLLDLATRLGLSVASLESLGIGWSPAHVAWSFPMSDSTGMVCGIRLRKPDGFKFAVRGSKEGLFIPAAETNDDPLLVCEGVTDTAALLDLGFASVVGRPSCTGGIKHVVDLVQARKSQQVVLIADGDEPGQRGAANLASVLQVYVPSVRQISPPDGIKDVRAWLQNGATSTDLRTRIDAAPVRKITIQSTLTRRGR